MEGETSSAGEDDWTPNTIHSVKQKIHSTRSMSSNGPEFFTVTALVNNRPIKFIIDSGSPVTLIPKSQFNKLAPLRPLETEYRDVNDNRIRFEGKTTAKVEINGTRKELELLVTTKKTNPLLGLDWMKKIGNNTGDWYDRPTNTPNKRRPRRNKIKNEIQKTVQRKPYSERARSKNTTERRRKTDTTERKTHTDTFTTINGKRN